MVFVLFLTPALGNRLSRSGNEGKPLALTSAVCYCPFGLGEKKKKHTPKTAISSERRGKKDVKICFVGNVPKQPRWLEILLLKLTL